MMKIHGVKAEDSV